MQQSVEQAIKPLTHFCIFPYNKGKIRKIQKSYKPEKLALPEPSSSGKVFKKPYVFITTYKTQEFFFLD